MKLNIKRLSSIWIALSIIFLIEATLFLKIGQENIAATSTRLDLFDTKFKKFASGDNHVIRLKSELVLNSEAEFIQIGDSSGLFGVRGNIVKEYLGGMDYINASCCVGVGWDGYAYTADYFLRKNRKAKYLVLYVTPYSLPMMSQNNNSEHLKKLFNYGSKVDLFQYLLYVPSLYFKEQIQNSVYGFSAESRAEGYKRLLPAMLVRHFEKLTGYRSEQLPEFLEFSRGWFPFDFKSIVHTPKGECGSRISDKFFDQNGNPTLARALSKISKTADKYNVKTIVMFNPVICTMSKSIEPILADISLFQKNNPEVYIPFNFITTWSEHKAADEWHLRSEASVENSHRVGKALREMISSTH
jgi:hypothetical protein